MGIFQPKAAGNVKHCDKESDVKCIDVTQRGSAGFVRCLNRQYVTKTSAGVRRFNSRQKAWNLEQASTINLTVFFLFARQISERMWILPQNVDTLTECGYSHRMWILPQKRFANENVQKTGE
jgi:hypothetical protein